MRKLLYTSGLFFFLFFIGCNNGSDTADSGLSWISSPANGETNASANGVLTITFSETMNGNINIEYNTALDDFDDGESWSSDYKTLTITLGGALSNNTEYSYTMNPTGTPQTMGSQAGELIPENTTITFTTGS